MGAYRTSGIARQCGRGRRQKRWAEKGQGAGAEEALQLGLPPLCEHTVLHVWLWRMSHHRHVIPGE